MRISENQARENRERVVAEASRLFREKGFDGVSVEKLMKAAGFTHGGFYNHFESKEALALEAVEHAFRQMDEFRGRAETIKDFIDVYVSKKARSSPGSSCPAAALAGEVARQSDDIREVFADGVERMISSVVRLLPDGPDSRLEAIDVVCRMVGALALAQAMPRTSALGREVISAAKRDRGRT
ncbi:TetR/AcrR family transcriptional regulator [Tardiphaga sp. 42S5]|uniref:TetR/AcrR family transcriptional regulator n=1 Tax=Tardiphaga sp. 42S5 TaxID=1404799 RepID=UPI002A59965A|nr:TetR/AcrR family transcriptional regulator [Tardiphaga sp. 42S5]WPO43981.1 TetR/AcrR family transcriptional regulator [Tardiphaga sp. 42S5]